MRTSSEYCDRETDLYRGLVLYLLKVAFGHLFFNQPLDGALCSGWVYVPNLGLRGYNSDRNITMEDLICIGAWSGFFVQDLHWGLVLYLLKVAFGHHFFNQPLDGALSSGWDVCFEFRAEGVCLSSEYYDRVSDLN